MSRLYTNENFPQQAVQRLRDLGHDVETSHEAGNSGRAVPDAEVLAHAVQNQRILVTLNRCHFVSLHKQQPDHRGIVVCTFDPDFSALAERIHASLKGMENWRRRLIKVNRLG